MLTKDYKFYLSFENSICRDYVTEKFFKALRHYVVPIVNGGVDYLQFAPEGSFIHIRDFESPQHLAEYLQYLDKNQTAYEQYFEWRKKYVPSVTMSWCKLCEMLNNSSLPSKSYDNIYDWWVVEGQCNSEQPIKTSRPEVSFIWKNRSAVGTENTL
jgi:Glycosyltransferase family 10 (fucosyltransferase) C-term